MAENAERSSIAGGESHDDLTPPAFSDYAVDNAEFLENQSTVNAVPSKYPLFSATQPLNNFECTLIFMSYFKRIKTHVKIAESNRRELVPERRGAPWTLSVELRTGGSQVITVAIMDHTELTIITQPPNAIIVRFRCGIKATFTQGETMQGLNTNKVTFEFKRFRKKPFKASAYYYVLHAGYKTLGEKVLDNAARLANKALYTQFFIGSAATSLMNFEDGSWGNWHSKFWEPLAANELTLHKFKAKTPAKGVAAVVPDMWYARDPIAVLLKTFSSSVDTVLTEAIANILGDCELALINLASVEGELAFAARAAAAGGLPFPSGVGTEHYVRDCAA